MSPHSTIRLALTLLTSTTLIACGTPPDRSLESISLSPATAISTDGAIQFTATGHWNTSPTTSTLTDAGWGVCQNNTPTTAVTVTEAGVATCGKGAKGTYTVFANHPLTVGPVCNAIGACGGGCQVTGTAQLTCP